MATAAELMVMAAAVAMEEVGSVEVEEVAADAVGHRMECAEVASAEVGSAAGTLAEEAEKVEDRSVAKVEVGPMALAEEEVELTEAVIDRDRRTRTRLLLLPDKLRRTSQTVCRSHCQNLVGMSREGV